MLERMVVPFGPWVPDVPGLVLAADGVRRADDCIPIAGGYGPAPRRIEQLTVPVLPARARGGIAGIAFDGTSYNFVGTGAALYRLTPGTLTNKSKVGGYSLGTHDRWEIEAFGNRVFAATPQHLLQTFDLGNLGANLFGDVAGGPQARFVAAVGSHLFVGNLVNEPSSVQWSAIGNGMSWPTPGTDPAIAVQSGKNPLTGPGGHVMGIIGGAEVGAVFQERAVWRMDYVGGDVMWDFRRVEPARGLLVPGGAIDFGREVLFLAQDGFFRFDYTRARPVGQERINRYVLDQLDVENLDRVWMENVPSRPLVAIAFPGDGSSGGVPNKVLLYNWALDRFSVLTESGGAESLYRWQPFTSSVDDAPFEDIDTASGSYDDEETRLSEQRLAWFNSSHQLGTLEGSGREAVIETGLVQPAAGRSAVVRARPLVEGVAAKVAMAKLGRASEAIVFGSEREQVQDGSAPVRSDGRYHIVRVRIPEGDHSGASGVELLYRPSGDR